MKKSVTPEEIAQDLINPFKQVLDTGGIDDEYLINQLKKEFENEEPKHIKSSGKLDSRTLPKNYKVIAKPTKDNPYGDTIIECRLHNIAISQKARMDVHKLRGDYPAEKIDHKLTGDINVNIIKFSDLNSKPDNDNGKPAK